MQKGFLREIILLLVLFFPVRGYAQLPEVLAWEPDIRRFEHLDSTEHYADNAVLFLGSSSIRLWSTLAQDMAPYPIIQRGYGGAKLSDLVFYAERIIYPHSCRAMVIFVANDITGKEDDKTPGEVAVLAKEIIQIIRKKYPVTPIFWVATTPTTKRWQVWPKIAKANDLIREYCKSMNGVWFINTDFAFLNSQGLPNEEFFLEDKLHLNDKGYAIWTEIIRKELDQVLN